MSVQEIKAEMAGLPQDQQDHLAAYLVHLRHSREAEIRNEITARIEDQNPQHWISPAELKKKWEG